MTAQQPAVKKYIVKLSAEERNRLDVLIQKGKAAARQLLKARILLKADASTAGEAWSDSQIAAALDTSIDTIARTRQQLVEEGLDAALTRKHSPASARPRIFDGAADDSRTGCQPYRLSGGLRCISKSILKIGADGHVSRHHNC